MKKWFSKRDFIYLGVILYLIAKVYVTATPDPSDDELPDRVRDVLLHVAS